MQKPQTSRVGRIAKLTRSRLDAWSAECAPGMSSSQVLLHPPLERTPTPAVAPSEGTSGDDGVVGSANDGHADAFHAWGDWDTDADADADAETGSEEKEQQQEALRRPASRCFETQTEPVRIFDVDAAPERDSNAPPLERPDAEGARDSVEQQTMTDVRGSQLLVRAPTHNVKFQVRPTLLLDLLRDADTQTEKLFDSELRPPAPAPEPIAEDRTDTSQQQRPAVSSPPAGDVWKGWTSVRSIR